MMDYVHSILLGIIQGLTEFLPISSTAHLIIIPYLFKIKTLFLNSISFDIALHGGTLVAVLIYFRGKIKKLIIAFLKGIFNIKKHDYDFKFAIYLIIASLPAFIVGYFFMDIIENIFRMPFYPAVFLILFAFLLFLADRKTGNLKKNLNDITLYDAIVIGLFQAIALLPGVSRSGITITAGLFLKYKREDAAEFSFLLSVPAILGAFVFGLYKMIKAGIDINLFLLFVGFLFAFLSGVLAIKFLLNFIKKFSFSIFVIYRIILGIVILVFVLKGII